MIPEQGWNLETGFSHQPFKEPQPEFSMSFLRRVGGGKEYLETGEPAEWGPGALEGWGWSATCLGRRSGDKEGPSTPGGPQPAPANPDSK